MSLNADSEYLRPASFGYRLLAAICSECHGDPAEPFNLILKCLLSNTLMTCITPTPTVPSKQLQLIHQDTHTFLLSLCEQNPTCLLSLFHYIQHVCIKQHDRAEYRRIINKSIIHLVLHFAPLCMRFVSFLMKMSKNAKIGVRALAVDLASMMIEHAELIRQLEQTNTERDAADAINATEVIINMLKILLCRCSDRSPVVRAKALTDLAAAIQQAAQEDEALKTGSAYIHSFSVS